MMTIYKNQPVIINSSGNIIPHSQYTNLNPIGVTYSGQALTSNSASSNVYFDTSIFQIDKENLEWLLQKLALKTFPLTLSPTICSRCSECINQSTIFKFKRVLCQFAMKNENDYLLIWRDKVPINCPYILEHTVDLNS